jgi:hypothetical protein
MVSSFSSNAQRGVTFIRGQKAMGKVVLVARGGHQPLSAFALAALKERKI